MKVYVVCDLEGVAGVVDFKKQCMEDGAYYRQAIRMATQELNALVDGALEGGATEVWAWPGHGAFPGGIDVELLHPECRLVMHAGDGGPVGQDGGFDAMMLHGLHGMAGSEGVLAHSFMPFMKNIWINDLKIGEIALNMLGFGVHGVPTVFVSGDQTAVDEANDLVPGIEGAAVKWALEEKEKLGALSVRKAISLSPGKAQAVIREAAKRAMGKVGSVELFTLDSPYAVKVEYTERKYGEWTFSVPGVEKVNETTTLQTRDSLDQIVF
ncbi:M55 family metallopeptidase [Candidatus Bathyarchaeota archaeon]|nr:M55 family metallopeptidase [Candidatus Bathyarchaeota archaeon]